MNEQINYKEIPQLPPPTQEIRPFGDGRSPVQCGKEIGIIYRALSGAPLWQLQENHRIGQHERSADLSGRTPPTVEFAT